MACEMRPGRHGGKDPIDFAQEVFVLNNKDVLYVTAVTVLSGTLTFFLVFFAAASETAHAASQTRETAPETTGGWTPACTGGLSRGSRVTGTLEVQFENGSRAFTPWDSGVTVPQTVTVESFDGNEWTAAETSLAPEQDSTSVMAFGSFIPALMVASVLGLLAFMTVAGRGQCPGIH